MECYFEMIFLERGAYLFTLQNVANVNKVSKCALIKKITYFIDSFIYLEAILSVAVAAHFMDSNSGDSQKQ